jgi:hypothetical protein
MQTADKGNPMITLGANENPCLMKVGDLTGHFFVPAYQRGYRWGKDEVEALLDDIYLDGQRGKDDKYCLQPVVVKRRAGCVPLIAADETGEAMPPLRMDVGPEQFELIDGQQRLTTLYLLYHYLQTKVGLEIPLRFSLFYQTRPRSTGYLRSLAPAEADDNIDFFHMHSAYQCISSWFEDAAKRTKQPPQFLGFQIFSYLSDQIRVIWYDAGEADATTLFTRLNVGRIALTNAELVKALMLAQHGRHALSDEHRQVEIATQWDMIERELQKDEFWAFLTNKPAAAYPTRIEFLFDLIAKKPDGEKERFFTFLHFKRLLDEQEGSDPKKLWARVLGRFFLLREWFEDRDLYHKVGYLVAVGIGLSELLEATERQLTKTAFRTILDQRIRTKLGLTASQARELSYDTDGRKCERLLLLFNVESVRRLEHSSERYPFHSHKSECWSLEHIHAQHSEQLATEEQWRSWLLDSCSALAAVRLPVPAEEAKKQVLLDDITLALQDKIDGKKFRQFASQVMLDFLHPAGMDDTTHSIANLALLSGRVNSALNNGAFQSKRLRLIELDSAGMFIPICTRRVFFKYYTDAGSQQMHLWSRKDQEVYVDRMLSAEAGVGHYLQTATEAD